MKNILIGLVFTFSVSLFAQQDPEGVRYQTVLAPGEFLAIGDKSIKFKSVLSDSRCPREVTCIWPGEAKILFEVFENGKLLEEQVISSSTPYTAFNFMLGDITYGVSSLAVFPYPSASQKRSSTTEYTIQVQVTGK